MPGAYSSLRAEMLRHDVRRRSMIRDWYYKSSRGEEGPFTTEQIVKALRSGGIEPESLVWQSGDKNSRHAKDVPDFGWPQIHAEHQEKERENRKHERIQDAKGCLTFIGVVVFGIIGLGIFLVIWGTLYNTTMAILPYVMALVIICVIVGALLKKGQ